MRCSVIMFSVVVVVMVPMSLVSACPSRPPIAHCKNFEEDERRELDGRYYGLQCILDHVTKDQPAAEPAQLQAVEHSVLRHQCGPLGPAQLYRYQFYDYDGRHPKPLRWVFQRELRGSSYDWAKDGKVLDGQCGGDDSCQVQVVDGLLSITDIQQTDKGTYSCVRIHSCRYESPFTGTCKLQRGSTFRLVVTAREASSTTTPTESVTSAAPSILSSNIVSTTLTSLLRLTNGVIVQTIIPPQKSIETETHASSTADVIRLSVTSHTPNATKQIAPQVSGSTVVNSHGTTEGQETWKAVSGQDWQGKVSAVDSEYDTADMDDTQWPLLSFTYPPECPWCTGNCPCLKKRKRKDIRI